MMGKIKPNQADQSNRFIEAAREIGTDENPEAFKQRLKKLVSKPSKLADGKSTKGGQSAKVGTSDGR